MSKDRLGVDIQRRWEHIQRRWAPRKSTYSADGHIQRRWDHPAPIGSGCQHPAPMGCNIGHLQVPRQWDLSFANVCASFGLHNRWPRAVPLARMARAGKDGPADLWAKARGRGPMGCDAHPTPMSHVPVLRPITTPMACPMAWDDFFPAIVSCINSQMQHSKQPIYIYM